jgi:ketosteroid isomerase-like protein
VDETDRELIERTYSLLNSDDYEQALPFIAQDFEMITTSEVASEPGIYRGPEGVRRWWESFLEVMEWVRLETHSLEDAGPGRALVGFEIHTRGRSSGIETSLRAVAVVTVADGLVTRMEFFTTLELAREAVGLPPS